MSKTPTSDEMLDWCAQWLTEIETIGDHNAVRITYVLEGDVTECVTKSAPTMEEAFRKAVAAAMVKQAVHCSP